MASRADFVDNVERQTWDLAEYKRKAAEKAQEIAAEEASKNRQLSTIVRAPLKPREQDLELFGKVGKFTVVTASTPLAERGGFYCDVCECLLRDSNSYLDHVNGRKHQKMLGMTMCAERATLQQVRDRLHYHKQKDEATKQKAPEDEFVHPMTEFEERRKQKQLDKKRKKAEKRKARQSKKAKSEESADHPAQNAQTSPVQQQSPQKQEPSANLDEIDGEDDNPEDEMAKLMGFGSFGGSKKA